MTDKQYLNCIISLYEELKICSASDPFDSQAWYDVHARIMSVHSAWYRKQRRRPRFMIFIYLLWLLSLALVVYSILRPL